MTESDNPQTRNDGSPREDSADKNLVRLLKPVVIADDPPGPIDEHVVSAEYYNRFTYSLLAKGAMAVNLTVGVTSANPGDGKTLVASNLAVSLALANRRDTVVVDLSIRNPRLHSVFGTPLGPGLIEAIDGNSIRVWKTMIDHLHVLPAGAVGRARAGLEQQFSAETSTLYDDDSPILGLDKVVAFRDVIYSLRESFEFVIVDMPVLQEPRVPVLLTHQVDGLIVVVDATRTKHRDVERMFRQLNTNQILGFVFNRASDDVLE
jgi:Mrp family chromosome partitioning ATPase